VSRKEIIKRYLLFIISLFFSAVGIAFTKHGMLGVSPISSVANVMSHRFTDITMGTWLIIWNFVLIFGQIVLLRKKFQKVQWLQVPLSFIFGWCIDLGSWIAAFIPVNSYPMQIVMVLVGTTILGFGVSLAFIANVIMNSGEAFVKALSDTTGIQFGNMKIIFDVCCVAAAIVLSLFLFNWTIVGTREGTVICALLTGHVVKFFNKRLLKPINGILQT